MNLLLVEMRMAMEYDSKMSKYPRKPFYATSDTRYKLVEKRNEHINNALRILKGYGVDVIYARPYEEKIGEQTSLLLSFIVKERKKERMSA